ncbi:hypothetical protein SAMN05444157_0191 [Frankineae bacterium MT45]|nr:hypothetical protein SAMN05444157_0191 [Frankineae bacterium MT45]
MFNQPADASRPQLPLSPARVKRRRRALLATTVVCSLAALVLTEPSPPGDAVALIAFGLCYTAATTIAYLRPELLFLPNIVARYRSSRRRGLHLTVLGVGTASWLLIMLLNPFVHYVGTFTTLLMFVYVGFVVGYAQRCQLLQPRRGRPAPLVRFNPPPNWPPPPVGWTPPAGWMPDPRWGPAPAGWPFWVYA